jgi:hypothetical protein
MNWFEALTGFAETDYAGTRARLRVEGERLHSTVNGLSWHIGRLSTPSLGELRAASQATREATRGRLQVRNISAEAHRLHAEPEARGALIQVASQFNLLEMVHYDRSPEDGITVYATDRTQGPACAMAAAPATLFRNYFAPVAGESGQTRTRQIDTLAELARALPGGERIRMQNGYALLDARALGEIDAALAATDAQRLDAWRALLRIGLHQDVEVTAAGPATGQWVSQAFCSALPVSYNRHGDTRAWERFACLVLEAAYEATLLAGLANAARGASPRVYLTLLGGGAFGNPQAWILRAIRRALDGVRDQALQVHLVSHGAVHAELRALEDEYA